MIYIYINKKYLNKKISGNDKFDIISVNLEITEFSSIVEVKKSIVKKFNCRFKNDKNKCKLDLNYKYYEISAFDDIKNLKYSKKGKF